jgi:hypothetical protein
VAVTSMGQTVYVRPDDVSCVAAANTGAAVVMRNGFVLPVGMTPEAAALEVFGDAGEA